jgi:DNA-binding phage protein
MTNPYQTTVEQVLVLAGIIGQMQKVGLDPEFVVGAYDLARVNQGVFDLMELWSELPDGDPERDEAIADIQDLIDDHREAPAAPLQKPKIRFDELDRVVQSIVAGKARLRIIIDRHGGVSAVARKTGIPQPSLSRMLADGSMPRRTTLYKIAEALDLSEADIAQEWTR